MKAGHPPFPIISLALVRSPAHCIYVLYHKFFQTTFQQNIKKSFEAPLLVLGGFPTETRVFPSSLSTYYLLRTCDVSM